MTEPLLPHLLAIRAKLQRQQPTPGGAAQVTVEKIEAVLGSGKYQVRGAIIPTTGTQPLQAGQMVPVAWDQGRPVVILQHSARRATFAPISRVVGKVIEELFIATDPDTGLLEVFFRNSQQTTSLKIRSTMISNPVDVGWGPDGTRFVVDGGFIASFTFLRKIFYVFKLNREEGEPYRGSTPEATLERTEILGTDTLDADSPIILQVTSSRVQTRPGVTFDTGAAVTINQGPDPSLTTSGFVKDEWGEILTLAAVRTLRTRDLISNIRDFWLDSEGNLIVAAQVTPGTGTGTATKTGTKVDPNGACNPVLTVTGTEPLGEPSLRSGEQHLVTLNMTQRRVIYSTMLGSKTINQVDFVTPAAPVALCTHRTITDNHVPPPFYFLSADGFTGLIDTEPFEGYDSETNLEAPVKSGIESKSDAGLWNPAAFPPYASGSESYPSATAAVNKWVTYAIQTTLSSPPGTSSVARGKWRVRRNVTTYTPNESGVVRFSVMETVIVSSTPEETLLLMAVKRTPAGGTSSQWGIFLLSVVGSSASLVKIVHPFTTVTSPATISTIDFLAVGRTHVIYIVSINLGGGEDPLRDTVYITPLGTPDSPRIIAADTDAQEVGGQVVEQRLRLLSLSDEGDLLFAAKEPAGFFVDIEKVSLGPDFPQRDSTIVKEEDAILADLPMGGEAVPTAFTRDVVVVGK